MSRKFYCPVEVNNQFVSKEVKKWYCSVGGVSKKVKKAYCSVNGLSKLFYEAGSSGYVITFEYNYASGITYNIHNYLTLSDTLDACYDKFMADIGTYPTTYAQAQSLIDNWQSIKAGCISALGNCTNVYINLSLSKTTGQSNSYVYMNVWVGSSTFPMNVKVRSTSKDSMGNLRYADIYTSGADYPVATKHLTAYAYEDGTYSVGSVQSSYSDQSRIRYYNADTSGTYSAQITSFGLVKTQL